MIKIGVLHNCCAYGIDKYITTNYENVIVGYKSLDNWEEWFERKKLFNKVYSADQGTGVTTLKNWEAVINKIAKESDVILTWGIDSDLEELNKFKYKPIVLTAHGQCTWTRKFIKYSEQFANHFLSVSELAKLTYSANIREKVKVIPNSIDTNIFRPLDKKQCRKELGLPEDGTIIGMFGRKASYKGYERFSEIMKLLPEYKGLVVGGAVYNNKDIIHRPFHIGTMEKHINSIDCYVNLSMQEGDNTTIKEAMACKVPSVVTPVGSVLEMKIKYNCPNEIVQLYFDDNDIANTIKHQVNHCNTDKLRQIIKENFNNTSILLENLIRIHKDWKCRYL